MILTSKQMREHRIRANGLNHNVLEWPAEGGGDPVGTVLLLHGYMDAGATWDFVTPHLTAANFRVFAPDLRGFGDTDRIPAGGYYHFPDYIADVAELIDALSLPTPLYLVGHSMGGVIATMFTGAFPAAVAKLALLEGSGPPGSTFDTVPDRMRTWIDNLRATRQRNEAPRNTNSESHALRRLYMNHPLISHQVLKTRLPHLVKHLSDGTVEWKFDPLHKTTAPIPFYSASYVAFAERVACPVLAIGGGPTGWRAEDEAARLAAFKHLTEASIESAGHMMHWTEPAEVGRLIVNFFRR